MAKAGKQVGDVITGYFPVRKGPWPSIRPTVVTEFRFGLAAFEPGAEAFVDVQRGVEQHRLEVTPSIIAGGTLESIAAAEAATDAFFAIPD